MPEEKNYRHYILVNKSIVRKVLYKCCGLISLLNSCHVAMVHCYASEQMQHLLQALIMHHWVPSSKGQWYHAVKVYNCI